MSTTRRDFLHLAGLATGAAVGMATLSATPVEASELEGLFALYAEKEAEVERCMSVTDSYAFQAPDEVWAAQLAATDEMCAVAVAICAYRAADAKELSTKARWLLDYTEHTELEADECEALLRSMA